MGKPWEAFQQKQAAPAAPAAPAAAPWTNYGGGAPAPDAAQPAPQAPPAAKKPPQYGDDAYYSSGIYAIPGLGPMLASFSKTSNKFERGVADSASLGFADEASAGLSSLLGGNYDEQLAKSRKELADSGTAGTIGQLVGGLLTPGGTGWKQAAALSAAYGFGSGEGTGNRLAQAGVGGVLGGATGALVNRVSKLFGGGADKVARTAGDALSSGSGLYKQAEDEGVRFGTQATSDLADQLRTVVGDVNPLNQGLRPKTAGFLDDINKGMKGDVSLEDFDALRKRIGKEISHATTGDDDARVLNLLVKKMDDFADNVDPALMTGDAGKAIPLLTQARSEWRIGKQKQAVEKIFDQMDLKSGTRKVSDTAKMEATKLYNRIQNGAEKGWSDENVALIRSIAKGDVGAVAKLGKVFDPKTLTGLVAGQVAGSIFPGGSIAFPLAGQLASKSVDDAAVNGLTRLSQNIDSVGLPPTVSRWSQFLTDTAGQKLPRTMLGGTKGLPVAAVSQSPMDMLLDGTALEKQHGGLIGGMLGDKKRKRQ